MSLGDDVPTIQSASSLRPDFGAIRVFFTDEPTNIEWRTSAGEFIFNDVGGTGETALFLDLNNDSRLRSLRLAWQNRPLNLREAVEHAKHLQTWLRESSYAPPQRSEVLYQAFVIIEDDYRPPTRRLENWSLAESALSDDAENIDQMRLYTMCSADTVVTVTAQNMRRTALNFQNRGNIEPVPGWRRTVFDGNGGYEWLLNVSIHSAEPDKC